MTTTDVRNVATLLDRFRAHVLDDCALQLRLMAIDEEPVFASAVAEAAAACAILLSPDEIRTTFRPDPLGLSRYDDRPPNTAGWPQGHWLPSSVGVSGQHYVVDWLHFGDRRPTEPFFEDSLRRVNSKPFNRFMRCRTSLAALADSMPPDGMAVPDGFIFHLSRCGSTLAAQMLGAMHDTIVVAEPRPLDEIVQLAQARPDVPVETRDLMLRAMAGALGRDGAGTARNYIVKLDCWHTLALPVLRRAFPTTPWIFLYRDPVEILVSHMRMRGAQTVPGALVGVFDIAGGETMPVEEYTARVLNLVSEAVLDHHTLGGGMLINYDALPGAVETQILSHFGIDPDESARAALRAASGRDAKSPSASFSADSTLKQQEATPAVRDAVATHMADTYRRLEALRLAQR